jgi:hypothetical protein
VRLKPHPAIRVWQHISPEQQPLRVGVARRLSELLDVSEFVPQQRVEADIHVFAQLVPCDLHILEGDAGGSALERIRIERLMRWTKSRTTPPDASIDNSSASSLKTSVMLKLHASSRSRTNWRRWLRSSSIRSPAMLTVSSLGARTTKFDNRTRRKWSPVVFHSGASINVIGPV